MDSRRRPTIPDEAMRAAGISVGDDLRIAVLEEGLIVLETPAHVLRRAKGRVRGSAGDRSVVDEFLAERRAQAAVAE